MSFSDTGSGPAVVLLHGFLENNTMWQGIIEELKSDFRIIAPDLPGHGNSSVIAELQTMPLMAERVTQLITDLNIKNAALVGHSMGGYVGLEMLKSNPELIRGLCLFHSTAAADSESKKKDRDRAVQVVKRNASVFIKEAIPNLFYVKNRSRLTDRIEELTAQALLTPTDGIIACLNGMKVRENKVPVVQFAKVPVHYIIGKEDTVVDASSMFDQFGDQTTFEVLNDVGHMGFVEAPDRTISSIREFLLRC